MQIIDIREIIMEIVLLVCCGINIILLLLVLWFVTRKHGTAELEKQIALLKDTTTEGNRQLMDQIARQSESTLSQFSVLGDGLRTSLDRQQSKLEEGFSRFRSDMDSLRKETGKQLTEVNSVVTEKLQSILDRKLNEAFDTIVKNMSDLGKGLNDAQERHQKASVERLASLEAEFTNIRSDIVDSMEKMRTSNSDNLERLQTEFTNIRNDILNSMEKVQSILDRKLNETFDTVVKNMSDLGKGLNDAQERQQNATVEQLKSLETEFKNIREAFLNSMESMQAVLDRKLNGAFDTVVKNMADLGKGLNDGQDRQQKATVECLNSLENAFVKIREDIVNTLEKIREDNTIGLDKMRSENQSSLDKINQTVNEKLQKTLNDRITQSFELVNKRLTEVYEGLGEMKNVASGVSDLKNVLSNVKSRGIMGEIQLGAILRDILAPEQYETQFKIDPNSTEMVDFAVRLPGLEDGKFVFLPIDSKFPGDSYASLVNAYDSGDPADIKQKRSILERELKRCAKSIHDKYIIPPYSTDFAIMFLPFEGLYAEVVNMGLVEVLQAEYRVNITGPSTMAAMLNSLQMGFRTLAIQKKSGEVWKILEAAKKEFSNFESVLSKTRDRLRQADDELEKLIGTRTRAINRKLQTVSTLDANEDSSELLELT